MSCAVVALVIAACGAPARVVGADATDVATPRAQVTSDGRLLDSVRPAGRCRLVEVVGALDDPDADADDAELGARVATWYALGVHRGPLVAVDAGDAGTTVVAATLFRADGQGFDTAVWAVDRTTATTVTAAEPNAAAGSDHPLAVVETAGEDPVADAMAFAEDCSAAAAAPFRPPAPPDPELEIRPDLMLAAPAIAVPGTVIALRFPELTSRGVAFQLERREGDRWVPVSWMTSDGNGGDPVTVPFGTDGYGAPDVGVGGPGPDRVRLPDEVQPGAYRVCTVNAGDEFCAAVEVIDPGTP